MTFFNKQNNRKNFFLVVCFFAVSLTFNVGHSAIASAMDANSEILLSALLSTGGEIRLTADVTLTNNAIVNNDTVLDLNGYTLSMGSKTIVTYADLTIKDDSSAQTGKITNTSSFAIQAGGSNQPGHLILESGTIQAGGYGVRVFDSFTMNGGTITGKSYLLYNQGESIINDGTLLATTGIVIQNYINGNLIVNGGTIKTEADYQAINMYENCTATINGGEILAPMAGTRYSGNGIAMYKNTTLTVNGGKISSYGNAILGNGSASGNNEGTNAKIIVNGGEIASVIGAGIYAPQINGETIVTGGTITGRTGIEIRAGKLTVSGGTISGSGEYEITSNTNGLTTKGTAISIAQHTTKQPIEVLIEGGTMEGVKPVSFTNPLDNPEEDIEKITIEIKGGTYEGDDYEDILNNIVDGYMDISGSGRISVVPVIAPEEGDKGEAEILVPNTGIQTLTEEKNEEFGMVTVIIAVVATAFATTHIVIKHKKSEESAVVIKG